VSLRDIADVLTDRAAHAGLVIPELLTSQLTVYYQLLSHWNRKINLTSLSDSDEAVDRLLLEPVAAAAYLPRHTDLVDLGSGGGSPAVPLALTLEVPRLVMVESRVRKAAFLREVLRELGLRGSVESARFEDVALRAEFAGEFGISSVRAVRLDAPLFDAVAKLLRPEGVAALFRTVQAEDPPQGLPTTLRWLWSRQLISASHSALALVQKPAESPSK
jgi:16S rRNA (guanine527-N7)-methyltransferase